MNYKYILNIKNSLENQIKLENIDEQYKGNIINNLSLKDGSLLTIEMAKCKNLRLFKENDKILINNKIPAKIVDIADVTYVCKVKNQHIKITSVTIRLFKSTTEKLLDNINLLLNGKMNHKLETLKLLETGDLEKKQCLPLTDYTVDLNESQKHAVDLAIGETSFKLIGPPGTGKTTCIVEMIVQLLKNNKKLLVCGPSNAALDNVMIAFVAKNTDFKYVRLGDSIKCKSQLKKYNLDAIIENEMEYLNSEIQNLQIERHNLIKKRSKTYEIDRKIKNICKEKHSKRTKLVQMKVEDANVVFSTLYSTIKLANQLFDVIIVDECCQANDSELLLSIVKADQLILVGDPHQLGPVTKLKQTKTLYEIIKLHSASLKEQYRMSENMIAFANSYFYKSEIISNKKSNFKFFDESNILFIDMFNSVHDEESFEKSKYNREEVKIIMLLLEYLRTVNKPLNIGIIVPYSAQVKMINEINHHNLDVTVNTVDSFQGQERDIIIVSMVRSNHSQEIGFMEEFRRTNVALTRCKEGLVVIANSTTFGHLDYYKQLFEFLDENACSFDHENFLIFAQDYIEKSNYL